MDRHEKPDNELSVDREHNRRTLNEKWAEALAVVEASADALAVSRRRIEELEASLRERKAETAETIEALKQRLIVAEVRADEQEEACRDAEEWVQRIHATIVKRFEQRSSPDARESSADLTASQPAAPDHAY